ncbi:MAG: MAPEG family protein, partial [Xanthomonadales bacterium]|nr:MAPEG family protein [Xanthomonadales bacterium]
MQPGIHLLAESGSLRLLRNRHVHRDPVRHAVVDAVDVARGSGARQRAGDRKNPPSLRFHPPRSTGRLAGSVDVAVGLRHAARRNQHPPFAIAVLMAQFTQVDAQRVAWLAIAFIAFRILHGVFYLTGT